MFFGRAHSIARGVARLQEVAARRVVAQFERVVSGALISQLVVPNWDGIWQMAVPKKRVRARAAAASLTPG